MSNQFTSTRIDDDLTLLSDTLEEVLRSSGDPADQKYVELKARAEQALHDVKNRVSQASDTYYVRAKRRTVQMITCMKSRGRAWALVPLLAWY